MGLTILAPRLKISGGSALESVVKNHYLIVKFFKRISAKAESNLTGGFFEIIIKDPRSPILWIRSFKDDTLEINEDYGIIFEERVVSELKAFGPVIAIGDPKSKYPLMGAAREYFKNTEWLYAIDHLIQRSGIVVCVLGQTSGLEKEYTRILNAGKQSKLIVLIPPVPEEELKARWKLFEKKFGQMKLANDESLNIDSTLLLFKLNSTGIQNAVYCTDKRKDAYRLLLIKFMPQK